jgi:hypothetical protein
MRRKHGQTQRHRPSRGWRIALALAALGLCFAASMPTALGEERKPDDPPPNGPGYAAGDETIGTLPILQGPETIQIRRDLLIRQPSLCLEGDLDEIMSSIIGVRGDAVVQLEGAGLRTDRVRVIFPGKVQIAFDRLMIESSTIRVGMWMPGRTRLGELETVWNSRLATIAAGSQFVHLPVLDLSELGALSVAPYLVHAQGAVGSTFVTAVTDPDLLLLRQTH